jgi:hypothetical protein
MITYGCSPDEQASLAEHLRRIVEVTRLPARIGRHGRGFGVFVEWTVRGRGRNAARERSAAHWALMDAETVLGLRCPGAYASTCNECGATRANYDHTPAFCAALVALAQEFDVPLRIDLAECARCHRGYLSPGPRSRTLAGLCDACYRRAIDPGASSAARRE